ncbi:MAG: hypothetical protein KGL39_46430, partial [Patescibacteria group bacterium]|nr:hypothetical protein [Patescibacteria group bacterium]
MTTPKLRPVEAAVAEALKAKVPATAKKISLCMIARNAGDSLVACLESICEYVDEIVIVLAGESTDDTREKAR